MIFILVYLFSMSVLLWLWNTITEISICKLKDLKDSFSSNKISKELFFKGIWIYDKMSTLKFKIQLSLPFDATLKIKQKMQFTEEQFFSTNHIINGFTALHKSKLPHLWQQPLRGRSGVHTSCSPTFRRAMQKAFSSFLGNVACVQRAKQRPRKKAVSALIPGFLFSRAAMMSSIRASNETCARGRTLGHLLGVQLRESTLCPCVWLIKRLTG